MNFTLLFSTLSFLLTLSPQDVNSREKNTNAIKVHYPFIRILQFPQPELQFSFSKETTQFINSQEDWEKFWHENTLVKPSPQPSVDLNWKKELILVVAWPAEADRVDKSAAFLSARLIEWEESEKILDLEFSLLEPCFGLITDRSPVQFLVMKQEELKFNLFRLRTVEAQEAGCFDQQNPPLDPQMP